VLKTPGQRHRADDGAEPRHRNQPRQIGSLEAGLPVNPLPREQADGCRPGIEQRRRAESPETHAEALHQRRADAEQRRGQQGEQPASKGGQVSRRLGHRLSIIRRNTLRGLTPGPRGRIRRPACSVGVIR
jgi:hypothetical protein